MVTGANSTNIHPGKKIIDASDCGACHQLNKKAVGPSYVQIANRYKKQNDAIQRLATKIIKAVPATGAQMHS